jgi:dTDP-4-amino-4,6-dideoxygalactose transaminase
MSVVPSGLSAPPKVFRLAPWPQFGPDEIEAAVRVLESGKVNYWTGDEGLQFEQEFAAYVGARHAIAVANGTVALELALYALGIGPGDEVITTCRTFVACASCIVMRGATPVVADVDPVSQNLTAGTIRPLISPRTKAIIAVHLAGWPCDMDPILELAREHGLFVIEDCAQAHGATLDGRPVGSMGDLAAFSFCQDKIMTTAGEGGMLVTSKRSLWERAWSFKDHGKDHSAARGKPSWPPGLFRWVHQGFGTNWRLTEVQSAVGRVQLGKLDRWVAQRRANAAILTESFACMPGLRATVPPPGVGHSYYKYYAFVEPSALRSDWDRERTLAEIALQGIPCYTGICPELYLEAAFRGLGPLERYATARALGETSLMFLVHPTLGEAEMQATVAAVSDVMGRAVR